MNDLTRTLLRKFDEMMRTFRPLLFLSVDSSLQQDASLEVSSYLDELKKGIVHLRVQGECDAANLILACECYASGVMAELMISVCIKASKAEKAWEWFVDAKDSYVAALRAHRHFAKTEDFTKRLHDVEQLLFSPQTFMSAGFLVDLFECSICKRDYSECEHIASRPYCGEFCRMIACGIEVDHSAIVDEPSDKGCRVTEYEVADGFRNKLTGVVRSFTEKELAEKDETAGMRCTTILVRLDR